MAFKVEALSGRTDEDLVALLREAWEIAPAERLELAGRLVGRTNFEGRPFYVLTNMKRVRDGEPLTYPIEDQDIQHTVYVAPSDAEAVIRDNAPEPWLLAEVELSPLVERKKHNNPFGLRALRGTLRVLTDVPQGLDIQIFQLDGRKKLESAILGIYEQKFAKLFEDQQQELEEKVRRLSDKRERLDEQVIHLTQNLEEVAERRDSLLEEVSAARTALDNALVELTERSELMESKLRQLAEFAKERSSALVALDLIDERDMKTLIGESAILAVRDEACHDFRGEFQENLRSAVSYVQAHLHHKGIFYRRAVLNDFMAMLRTNDLIILAGDSGSGKTNLVKSFAEAIGGRSVIVPVKPNWTSSEDLLGYYNPIEKRYLSTPFLDALLEAARHPGIPYFICLDEMNLARVEYYFADFLSLLEERSSPPSIHLYSSNEESHALSEYRTFLQLIDEAKVRSGKEELSDFVGLLSDDQVNATLRRMCGFQDADSLLNHHARLRRLLSSFVNSPSSITLPENVRIIGAINVDETTHYLSPKILDRVHVMRFDNPLMHDWDALASEIADFDLDLTLSVSLSPLHLGLRAPYPKFDHGDELVNFLVTLAREYLGPLGVEFGLRTVRQARCYAKELQNLGANDQLVKNNIVLHKVLPKLTFDGQKVTGNGETKKNILADMRAFLADEMDGLDADAAPASCVAELDRMMVIAEANDWVVNYWSR